MKIQEVLLRALSGQISWVQAAEILGLSDRSMRRWRERLEHHGYDGLFDPPPAVSESEARATGNARASPDVVSDGVRRLQRPALSRGTRRAASHRVELQLGEACPAGRRASAPGTRAGAHRRRRERRPLPGMLLHIDASRHAWIPQGMHDLVSISDDATNELYYAQLVEEENTLTVMAAIRAVVARLGVFCAVQRPREPLHSYAARRARAASDPGSNERCSNSGSRRSRRIPRKPADARNVCTARCRADGPRSCAGKGSPPWRRPTPGWPPRA